jgi:hypothetical protein
LDTLGYAQPLLSLRFDWIRWATLIAFAPLQLDTLGYAQPLLSLCLVLPCWRGAPGWLVGRHVAGVTAGHLCWAGRSSSGVWGQLMRREFAAFLAVLANAAILWFRSAISSSS